MSTKESSVRVCSDPPASSPASTNGGNGSSAAAPDPQPSPNLARVATADASEALVTGETHLLYFIAAISSLLDYFEV